jgi:DNA-binding NarL/FixJ family response regulator
MLLRAGSGPVHKEVLMEPSQQPRPGVLVVDDNDLLGEAIERWLSRSKRVRWLGWTADAPGLPALITERRPDVVLLDVDMPGVDTFALLRRMLAEFPSVKVVMLSGHVRREYIERALDSGAVGYIIKDERVPDIVELVERAAAGECVLSGTAHAHFMAGAEPVRR